MSRSMLASRIRSHATTQAIFSKSKSLTQSWLCPHLHLHANNLSVGAMPSCRTMTTNPRLLSHSKHPVSNHNSLFRPRGGGGSTTSSCRRSRPTTNNNTYIQRYKSTSSSTTKKQDMETELPKSFKDFVYGTPVIVRHVPYFEKVVVDFGTTMMNFGAITSLSGFMMTDVLWLRSLSILGSCCGITYNLTRRPQQLNAVAWGLVFVTVNLVQIIRLILERREITFTVDEASLYYKHFEPFGVDPKVFQTMMHDEKMTQWKIFEAGDVLVEQGRPLRNVIMVVQGTASCHDGSNPSHPVLYTYSARENGSVIGGTAVVDPTVSEKMYPNQIVADNRVVVLCLNTKRLRKFLKEHPSSVEAALFHLMFVDLIGSLRRARKEKKQFGGQVVSPADDNASTSNSNSTSNSTTAATLNPTATEASESIAGLGMALHDLKLMLRQACADGVIHPAERRLIREFMEEHGISKTQFVALLQVVEWSEEEWEDGAKHDSAAFAEEGGGGEDMEVMAGKSGAKDDGVEGESGMQKKEGMIKKQDEQE